MNRTFIAGVFIFFCFTLMAPQTGPADELTLPLQPDSSWKQVNESDDGITVYSRRKEGSRVREVMAESSIEAPVNEVLKVVSDYANYAEFMPYVKKCEVLDERNGEVVVFQQLDFLPPISDRYYTIVLKKISDPQQEGGVQVQWKLAMDERAKKTGKGIGVPINRGGWRLLPESNGTGTKIYYYVLTDPGGSIPAWVSNIANTVAVPKIIRAVRDRVAKFHF